MKVAAEEIINIVIIILTTVIEPNSLFSTLHQINVVSSRIHRGADLMTRTVFNATLSYFRARSFTVWAGRHQTFFLGIMPDGAVRNFPYPSILTASIKIITSVKI